MRVTDLILHTNITVVKEALYNFLDEKVDQMNNANIGTEGLVSEHEILTYILTKFPHIKQKGDNNNLQEYSITDYGTYGTKTIHNMYAEYCVDRGLVDAGTL